MGYVIGANPYSGRLVETVDYLRGKGFKPGTRAVLTNQSTGESREFVSVKMAAGTWVNGIAILPDGLAAGGVGSAATTADGNPAKAINARLGILVFASATATHTTSTTCYGWAQIYGECKAWTSADISVVGNQLAIGSHGQLIAATNQTSASAQTNGITAIGTSSNTTSSMLSVFLNYPAFSGYPDANLA